MAARQTASASTKTDTTTKRVVRKPVQKTAVPAPSLTGHVNAYIPDESKATNYVHRSIRGVEDFTLFDEALENGHSVLIKGPTGSGKTMVNEAYAASKGLPFLSVPCDVSIDPNVFFGGFIMDEVTGKLIWNDGPFTEIFRFGGVINISEGNMMTPKMAAALFSLLDGRNYIVLQRHRGEIVRRHPKTLVTMDYNPGYRGTQELNQAFLNRFEIKVNWDYDTNVEDKLLKFQTTKTVALKLRAMAGVEILTPVSTNMLMEFEKFVLNPKLGLEFAIGNFVAAFAGDEPAAVEKIMELHNDNFVRDIASLTGSQTSDDEFEDEFVLDIDGRFEIRS